MAPCKQVAGRTTSWSQHSGVKIPSTSTYCEVPFACFLSFVAPPLPPRPAYFTVLLLVTCPVPPHAGIGGNLIQYFEFLDEDFSFRASLNPKKGADDSYAPK
jgi:hypothetical protein